MEVALAFALGRRIGFRGGGLAPAAGQAGACVRGASTSAGAIAGTRIAEWVPDSGVATASLYLFVGSVMHQPWINHGPVMSQSWASHGSVIDQAWIV